MESKPTLGYWKIRGLGAGIRYQMKYIGAEYNVEEYEQGPAPGFSRAPWTDVKPKQGLDFPNLPYFKDGDFSITETAAIHIYVADKWMPALLGDSAEQRAKVNMLYGIIFELKLKVTIPCYMGSDRSNLISEMNARLPGILKFIGDNKFIVGNSVTWLDFYFFELIELMKFLMPNLFEVFPALQELHRAVKELPKLKEYLDDPESLDNNR